MFDLRERVAIVTGGTRGIGLAIARALVDHGASVVVASRKADACARAAEQLGAAAGTAVGVPTHLGSPEDLTRLVDSTADRFGRIDIVVNNAATSLDQRLGHITPEIWAKTMDVNARGPLLLTQAAAPYLARQGGAVVNVVSVAAFTFNATAPVYGASKAALTSLTRAMAEEYSPHGIRVNALAPGLVATDMVARHGDREAVAELREANLMHRIAEPEEIAGPALFLVSDASSYMTGQVLVVDGGATAGR